MPDVIESDVYQIIWSVRRLFRSLARKAGDNLSEFGISAADRAVLEFLYPDKAMSVPELAERYDVSRQHVQETVNTLLEKGLAVTSNNPRHKRSPLVLLNANGRELFSAVLEKDEQAIRALFSGIAANDVSITLRTLRSLLLKLSDGNGP